MWSSKPLQIHNWLHSSDHPVLQVAWTSFHNDKAMVKKYLAQFHIGHITPEQREVEKDSPWKVFLLLPLTSSLFLAATANRQRLPCTEEKSDRSGMAPQVSMGDIWPETYKQDPSLLTSGINMQFLYWIVLALQRGYNWAFFSILQCFYSHKTLTEIPYHCRIIAVKLFSPLSKQGLFKTNPWFFVAHFSHIVLLYIAAWATLWYFGNGWLPWLAASVMMVTSQVCMYICLRQLFFFSWEKKHCFQA